MSRRFQAQVTHIEELTPFVKVLKIKRADGENFRLMGGQFFMLHFEHEGRIVSRSYSVANRVDETRTASEVELCVALVAGGLGSPLLHAAEVGDEFTLSGSHGRFILRPTMPSRIILVATGTGIAPFRSMLPGLEALAQQDHRIDLISGARTESDFLYDSEFAELANRADGFSYHRCASRPTDAAAHVAHGGIVGRVQEALDTLDLEVAEDIVFYLCGNEAMVADVQSELLEQGFARKSVRTEAYTSPPDD